MRLISTARIILLLSLLFRAAIIASIASLGLPEGFRGLRSIIQVVTRRTIDCYCLRRSKESRSSDRCSEIADRWSSWKGINCFRWHLPLKKVIGYMPLSFSPRARSISYYDRLDRSGGSSWPNRTSDLKLSRFLRNVLDIYYQLS